MKLKRRLRRMINSRNIAILVCIIVILIMLFLYFFPFQKKVYVDGVEIVQSTLKSNQQADETYAKKMGVKQFKKLGEKDIKENNIKTLKIKRNGEEYYYISSSKNTAEIKISNGNITRINGILIETN